MIGTQLTLDAGVCPCGRKAHYSTPLCLRCGRVPGADGLPARFWAQVETRPSGCAVWTGYTIWNGYGLMMLDGKTTTVHRIAYQARHGVTLRRDQLVDHLCRNRLCVNVAHLEVVTNRENCVRGAASLLGTKTSRYLGVSMDRRDGRWIAQVMIGGERVLLGRYAAEADAARAYDDAVPPGGTTNASLGLFDQEAAA